MSNETTEEGGASPPSQPSCKVFVAVPAYPDGTVQWLCVMSLLRLKDAFNKAGIEHQIWVERGFPWLSLARDDLAYKFLQSDCTDLLFVDCDVGFHADGVLKMIARPEPVICISYPKKGEHAGYAVDIDIDEDSKIMVNDGVLFRANHIGLGCAKIKRHVFDMILEAHPEIEYDWGPEQQRYNFFPVQIRDRHPLPEDASFSEYWRELGGQIWVLADVFTTHTGTKTWEGNFYDYLCGKEPDRYVL